MYGSEKVNEIKNIDPAMFYFVFFHRPHYFSKIDPKFILFRLPLF